MSEPMSLFDKWLDAKDMEREATEFRRDIEDRLMQELNVNLTHEGPQTFEPEGYKVKATVRINRTIDSDKLQEIAAESGLSDHLGELFRWKPSINMTEWKKAAPEITQPLTQAITAKPGRPSFTIEKE
ncbi:MAG: hypothetical protein WA981_00860 [Glaciecola sp.]